MSESASTHPNPHGHGAGEGGSNKGDAPSPPIAKTTDGATQQKQHRRRNRRKQGNRDAAAAAAAADNSADGNNQHRNNSGQNGGDNGQGRNNKQRNDEKSQNGGNDGSGRKNQQRNNNKIQDGGNRNNQDKSSGRAQGGGDGNGQDETSKLQSKGEGRRGNGRRGRQNNPPKPQQEQEAGGQGGQHQRNDKPKRNQRTPRRDCKYQTEKSAGDSTSVEDSGGGGGGGCVTKKPHTSPLVPATPHAATSGNGSSPSEGAANSAQPSSVRIGKDASAVEAKADPNILPPPSWSSQLSGLTSKLDVECAQVGRKYFNNFEDSKDFQDGLRLIHLTLVPTDPDFKLPALKHGFRISFSLTEAYPHEVPEVAVTSSEVSQSICEAFRSNLTERLPVGRDNMLRQGLKYIENHASSILAEWRSANGGTSNNEAEEKGDGTEQPWSSEEIKTLQDALAQFPESLPTKERWTRIGEAVGRPKKECLKKFKEIRSLILEKKQKQQQWKEEQSEKEKEERSTPSNNEAAKESTDGVDILSALLVAHSAAGVARGTSVTFVALRLKGISVAKCLCLRMQVQCARCKAKCVGEVSEDQHFFTMCPECLKQMTVHYRGDLVHEHNYRMGYLDVDNCDVVDYLPSLFAISCFECAKEGLWKDIVRARWQEKSCRSCHSKIRFFFESVKFERVEVPDVMVVNSRRPLVEQEDEADRPRLPKKKMVPIPGIKLGQPLPDKGKCKHYRKSYRWLRFPCCGMAFPCDICHEESAGDHEMAWANRMICGMCSKEQPFTQKPCTGCGKDMTGNKTGHWEGGQGCRDKTKMSNKDSKKYANLHKTISNKAGRVGGQK